MIRLSNAEILAYILFGAIVALIVLGMAGIVWILFGVMG